MTKHKELAKLLINLEQELISAKLWQSKPVDSKRLTSSQPFCHDSLQPEQWLQFVFIKKLGQLVKLSLPLPKTCDITPYFAETLKENISIAEITRATKQIDNLLSK